MDIAHPLHPLVLALSLRLNGPSDLLMEIGDLRVATHGEHASLAAMSQLGATMLARTAIAFNHAEDVAAFVDTDAFRSDITTAGTALMRVAMMHWPDDVAGTDEGWERERMFRRACLDMGAACFALGSGRVPRPDRGNLLTSLTKAIPHDLRHVSWTFYTLPDFGCGTST